MTIGSIGASSTFLPSDSDSVSGDAFTSVGGKLAALQLETQENQKEVAREELSSARHDFTEALSHEVESLRDEADAAYRAAWFQGAMSVASGGLGVSGALSKSANPWQTPLAKGLGDLAAPLGGLVGHNYGTATAKAAEGLEEAAKWRIEDGRDSVNDAGSAQDKALAFLGSIVERDAATATAVLSNMA